QALKDGYIDKVDSRHRLRGGVDRAQINRLAKSEIVRMEETAAAVRVRRIAEDLEQRALYIASEIIRIHADGNLYLERYLDRTFYLDILACHSVAVHKADEIFLESRINGLPAQAVD